MCSKLIVLVLIGKFQASGKERVVVGNIRSLAPLAGRPFSRPFEPALHYLE